MIFKSCDWRLMLEYTLLISLDVLVDLHQWQGLEPIEKEVLNPDCIQICDVTGAAHWTSNVLSKCTQAATTNKDCISWMQLHLTTSGVQFVWQIYI